ncbi:hypothetical protein [Mahella australiensis]|uniref:PQ loop repeat protein n=1 Tax=Mahella australiensis (strain DSM 15567 / CIP 107919 / 50-1 BON) TaxID=697281 RepID=F4A318_MAHA5|nr:hypothetical protein [Mahella australiensis]AEE95233.1 hypothetical protein Mahau_0009 [Mahella australiensis 50-1 BON]
MSIFESIMLLCFGAAWPFSIYRSYKSRSTAGKSLIFSVLLLAGYMSGILHKIFYNYDNVIILYIINSIMVAIDILLYIRNKKYQESTEN